MPDWSEIVRQHGSLVWQAVYRLVNHDADAADCFQSTFLSAWEFAGANKVRNWPGLLKRLATARALDRLRQRYRERQRLTPLPAAELDGAESEPSQLLSEAELAEHLRAALATLDERQAEVFCLASLEDLNYRDIAKQMGVTVNHVGVLLSRAKAALREQLAGHRPAFDVKESQP